MKPLIFGIFFGLANGLTPGPTLTMVITQTLQYNLKEGIKIALAPLLFGIVIIPLSFMILSKLASIALIMIVISIIGAFYLFYLGCKLILSPTFNLYARGPTASFKKGMLINFISPYPYFFWLTVGTPFLVQLLPANALSATAFIAGYYIFLVGSKILVAYTVERTKLFINQSHFTLILRILGFSFVFFAFLFLRQAISFVLGDT